MKIINISRVLCAWMIFISVLLSCAINKSNEDILLYNFGPSDKLIILGVYINTYSKYCSLVIYCIINTCFRNISNNIISPWITHNIQDDSESGRINKRLLNKWNVYEISSAHTLYYWFDWFIYIHLLLSQIDIVIIEVVTDIISTAYVTRSYLSTPITTENEVEITDSHV